MSDIVQTYLPGPSLGKHRPPSMEENGTESSYVDEETRSISFFRSHNTDFFHQIASAMLLVVIWEPGLSLRCLSLSLSLSLQRRPRYGYRYLYVYTTMMTPHCGCRCPSKADCHALGML